MSNGTSDKRINKIHITEEQELVLKEREAKVMADTPMGSWIREMLWSDSEMTRLHEDFLLYQIHEGRKNFINPGLMKKFEKKQEIRSRQPKDLADDV